MVSKGGGRRDLLLKQGPDDRRNDGSAGVEAGPEDSGSGEGRGLVTRWRQMQGSVPKR